MNAALAPRRITVIQGEWVVSREEGTVLTTILGSCVAACIRDPEAGVGGMNHFLLPDGGDGRRSMDSERYGVHLMELLVNGLLKKGARRERLEAKLFGGCSTLGDRYTVGARNAQFAEDFLRAEGIRHVGGHTGGNQGRRIEYWPLTGRARQMYLSSPPPVEPPKPRVVAPSAPVDDIELF